MELLKVQPGLSSEQEFQKNKNYSGIELAEKLWPALENYLSSDEWHYEVGYDWLGDMVDTGDLGWDDNKEVWFLTHPDILVKSKDNKSNNS